MKTARRIQQIKPSATLAVSAKAMDLKAQGKEIRSLSVGEPDFPTPKHICDAAKNALDEGFTRYTQVPGIPELRQAIAEYYRRFYRVQPPMDATIVTNGGKQALFNLFQIMLDPGDEVLIPAPYWVSYPAMVELAGGVTSVVATTPENDFKMTPEDLEKAINPKTTALILNSPSNPTGCHYTPEEIGTLVQVALDNNVFIISDEIYDQLIYPPAKPASLAGWWEKYPDMIAVVNGLAKSFAMTGWRVGFVLSDPEIIKLLSKIQSQSTSNICSIAQKAALAALTGPWEPVEEMRRAFERRRDLAMEIVNTWPDVICPKPDGAFYIFPDVHKHYGSDFSDSTSLCTALLEKAGTAVIPGIAFGDDHCIRISYAVSDDVFVESMEKIRKVLIS